MRDEAIMGVRTLDTDGTTGAAEVKAKVAGLRNQLNLSNMLIELPAVVKEVEDQLAKKKLTLEKMKLAQEGGVI